MTNLTSLAHRIESHDGPYALATLAERMIHALRAARRCRITAKVRQEVLDAASEVLFQVQA